MDGCGDAGDIDDDGFVVQHGGRVEDVVIAKDGRKMVRFHSLFVNIPHLIRSQVVQLSLDAILIRLKVNNDFDTNNEGVIKSRLIDQLGIVTVQFEYVTDFPKNANGKIQAVISNLKQVTNA